MMTHTQMERWAAIQGAVTEAGYENGGISLDMVANAIADNLDVPETRRLIHFLEAEVEKKLEEESIIH